MIDLSYFQLVQSLSIHFLDVFQKEKEDERSVL